MKEDLRLSKLSKSEIESRRNKTVSFIILLFICALWFFPFLYIIGMSLRTTNDMVLHPTGFFPHKGGWTLENYTGFFRVTNGKMDTMLYAIINSLITTVCHVIVSVVVTVFAAYSFVFMKYKGRGFIYSVIIATMAIPGVIGFASSYSMFITIGKQFNILDNLLYFYSWLIFPGVSGAFNLMILVNCFKSIPKELIESARADGATEFKAFKRVAVPLAKSSIIVCALFSFNGCWNALLFPELVIASQSDPQSHTTITVMLMGWIGSDNIEQKGLAMASCVISVIPLMIMYVVAQNKMIDGLASTGVKG